MLRVELSAQRFGTVGVAGSGRGDDGLGPALQRRSEHQPIDESEAQRQPEQRGPPGKDATHEPRPRAERGQAPEDRYERHQGEAHRPELQSIGGAKDLLLYHSSGETPMGAGVRAELRQRRVEGLESGEDNRGGGTGARDGGGPRAECRGVQSFQPVASAAHANAIRFTGQFTGAAGRTCLEHSVIHGLALSLAGLWGREARTEKQPRELLNWAAEQRVRTIVLDAAMLGLRPRELDRPARRDLSATLRRIGIDLGGVELWIPPAHFTDAAHVDRAVEAASGAIEFTSEMALLSDCRATLGMDLLGAPESVVVDLARRAERWGVVIGDHAWPPRDGSETGAIRWAMDPAAVLRAGADPAQELIRRGAPVSARLLDVGPAGRAVPGLGRLDVREYVAALAACGYSGALVLDVRGLPEPERALRAAQDLLATIGA